MTSNDAAVDAGLFHPGNLFHTGLVVADLDEFMAELTDVLGVTWKGGRPSMMQIHLPDGPREVEMRIAHTVEGPPHLEVIQSVPDTPWDPAFGLGTHHLCYWSDRPDLMVERLEGRGYHRAMGAPGSPGGYFRGPANLLVEVLSRQAVEHLSDWITRPSHASA